MLDTRGGNGVIAPLFMAAVSVLDRVETLGFHF